MITVVLLRPETPGNIGFISRAMANFDCKELIIISPLCNHLGEEALRNSMHAKEILKKATVKKYEYLSNGKIKKDFDLVVGTTSAMGDDYNVPRIPMLPEDLAKRIKNEKIALVLGNEGNGLTNDEIKKCDFLVTIPTSKKYPAMNISHAAAIVLYELNKRRENKNILSHIKPASGKEKEIIEQAFDSILDNLEFATKEKKETQRSVWKKIFQQSMMSKREAFSAIGLLRKLLGKLKSRKN